MDNKYRLLIVEDSKIDRFKLHSFLADDYCLFEAENGLDALRVLGDNSDIDIVISDLLMPEMSGMELLTELSKTKNLKEFPFLIATGAEDIEVELECLELGCADFIRKPYNEKLLKMRVENTLARLEYNRLKQSHITDTFSKFVDPAVVGSALNAGTGAAMTKLCDVTVLFADIRRFTTASESLSPQEVLNLLNDSFEVTSSCVKKYGGVIDKYIGDCTMAFWGAPNECEDSAYLACCAALEMVEKTDALLKSYSTVNNLSLGIGINKGNAIAGYVGSADRINYTVVGDNVNVASRLEGIAPEKSIYIGSEVYEQARDRIIAEKYPVEVFLKGRMRPVDVYKLTGLTEK